MQGVALGAVLTHADPVAVTAAADVRIAGGTGDRGCQREQDEGGGEATDELQQICWRRD
jgi:hypothetical protein